MQQTITVLVLKITYIFSFEINIALLGTQFNAMRGGTDVIK